MKAELAKAIVAALLAAALTAGCSGERQHDDDADAAGGRGAAPSSANGGGTSSAPKAGGAGRSSNAAGASGTAGSAGRAADCADPSAMVNPLAAIDDMEDDNGNILELAGRNGGWWTAADETVGGSMVPEQTALTGSLPLPEALPAPRCGSLHAMRVTGQGFADWGAELGVALVFGTQKSGATGAVAYDASAYQGVDFYARIGDTSTAEVRFEVSDSNSEPDGGVCVDKGAVGEQCYDSFGVSLPQLDTTFRHYRIPFAGLTQRNFGYPASAVVTTAIYQLLFTFPAGSIFDFWIDDLSFY